MRTRSGTFEEQKKKKKGKKKRGKKKRRRRRRVREKLGEQRKGGTGAPPSLHALAARLPRLPLGFVPLFSLACGDPARSEAPPGAAMRR